MRPTPTFQFATKSLHYCRSSMPRQAPFAFSADPCPDVRRAVNGPPSLPFPSPGYLPCVRPMRPPPTFLARGTGRPPSGLTRPNAQTRIAYWTRTVAPRAFRVPVLPETGPRGNRLVPVVPIRRTVRPPGKPRQRRGPVYVVPSHRDAVASGPLAKPHNAGVTTTYCVNWPAARIFRLVLWP